MTSRLRRACSSDFAALTVVAGDRRDRPSSLSHRAAVRRLWRATTCASCGSRSRRSRACSRCTWACLAASRTTAGAISCPERLMERGLYLQLMNYTSPGRACLREARLGGARGDRRLQHARRAPRPARWGRASCSCLIPRCLSKQALGRRARDRGALRRARLRRDRGQLARPRDSRAPPARRRRRSRASVT